MRDWKIVPFSRCSDVIKSRGQLKIEAHPLCLSAYGKKSVNDELKKKDLETEETFVTNYSSFFHRIKMTASLFSKSPKMVNFGREVRAIYIRKIRSSQ